MTPKNSFRPLHCISSKKTGAGDGYLKGKGLNGINTPSFKGEFSLHPRGYWEWTETRFAKRGAPKPNSLLTFAGSSQSHLWDIHVTLWRPTISGDIYGATHVPNALELTGSDADHGIYPSMLQVNLFQAYRNKRKKCLCSGMPEFIKQEDDWEQRWARMKYSNDAPSKQGSHSGPQGFHEDESEQRVFEKARKFDEIKVPPISEKMSSESQGFVSLSTGKRMNSRTASR
nr:hypothetical protein CQW23_32851 [Ipomoea batatas]